MDKLYAIYVDEGHGEFLVFQAMIPSEKRFYRSGSDVTGLVFTNPNTAHAFVKRNGLLEEFEQEAQYYVRKVVLSRFG